MTDPNRTPTPQHTQAPDDESLRLWLTTLDSADEADRAFADNLLASNSIPLAREVLALRAGAERLRDALQAAEDADRRRSEDMAAMADRYRALATAVREHRAADERQRASRFTLAEWAQVCDSVAKTRAALDALLAVTP